MQAAVKCSTNPDIAAAVKEAVGGLSDLTLLMFVTSYDRVEKTAEEIKKQFPGVPCVGTCGTVYHDRTFSDTGLTVSAFGKGAEVKTGVIRDLSICPVFDEVILKKNLEELRPGNGDTACLEFCTNDEERLVSTMNISLGDKKVPLVGGSVFGVPEGKSGIVAVDGVVYTDACAYAIVKNLTGKVRTYRENIYHLREGGRRHIATKVNLAKKELVELDGRPAAKVYGDELGIFENQIVNNVLKNPLGRIVGDDVFICSQYAIGSGGSLINYKRFNPNDTVGILELGDYKNIRQETNRKIASENKHVSYAFLVNCIYRHVLFQNEHYIDTFLTDMSKFGQFMGYVGGGEQYKEQHVNQTAACAVFE